MIYMKNYEIATGYALATTSVWIATLPLVARNDILIHDNPLESLRGTKSRNNLNSKERLPRYARNDNSMI